MFACVYRTMLSDQQTEHGFSLAGLTFYCKTGLCNSNFCVICIREHTKLLSSECFLFPACLSGSPCFAMIALYYCKLCKRLFLESAGQAPSQLLNALPSLVTC